MIIKIMTQVENQSTVDYQFLVQFSASRMPFYLLHREQASHFLGQPSLTIIEK